jgi:hypothetical protein
VTPGEFKTKWMEALRSGRYKQGSLQLRGRRLTEDEDRYCCLGVAFDIAVQNNVVDAHWLSVDSKDIPWAATTAGDQSGDLSASLPRDLREEIGLTQEQQFELWSMNDGYKMPFNVIADWIEANLNP